jgi:uncharacterized phiE125 gp8 family phage protein
MMLIEQTAVAAQALPVAALADHLRLGSGFADDGLQDGLLEAHLRAAIGVIEARIGKALLVRRFLLQLQDWWDNSAQALPVAPVGAVVSVTLVDGAGQATVVPPERWRLVSDTHRPKLASRGSCLPAVPADGRIEVVFDAGFGSAWGQVPPDLAQATLMLAAQYYEQRHDPATGPAGLPRPVQALIERWRTVRLLGGGGRA